MLLDAIITAGEDPGNGSELLAFAGGAPHKALIELEGRTFLDRVVAALLGSGRIKRVVVVGLPPEHRPDLGSRVTFLPDAGGMLENGEASLAYLCSMGDMSERILTSACDIPLVSAGVVNDLVDQCLAYDVDFCYSIVSKEVMERAFPGSGRTFVPLVEGSFAGGDISLIKPALLDVDRTRMHELIGQRKTFWKQVRVIGLGTLFLFLIRRLSIARLERRVARVFGITGKAIVCPHPEVAMDVDKPHHLVVIRAALERQKEQV